MCPQKSDSQLRWNPYLLPHYKMAYIKCQMKQMHQTMTEINNVSRKESGHYGMEEWTPLHGR